MNIEYADKKNLPYYFISDIISENIQGLEELLKLTEYFTVKDINMGIKSRSKNEVLAEMAGFFCSRNNIADSTAILDIIMQRERVQSTGIGCGIAIPHGKTDRIDRVKLSVGLIREGIEFSSLDKKPAHLIFLVISPESEHYIYLSILAKISRLFQSGALLGGIIKNASTAEDVFRLIQAED